MEKKFRKCICILPLSALLSRVTLNDHHDTTYRWVVKQQSVNPKSVLKLLSPRNKLTFLRSIYIQLQKHIFVPAKWNPSPFQPFSKHFELLSLGELTGD